MLFKRGKCLWVEEYVVFNLMKKETINISSVDIAIYEILNERISQPTVNVVFRAMKKWGFIAPNNVRTGEYTMTSEGFKYYNEESDMHKDSTVNDMIFSLKRLKHINDNCPYRQRKLNKIIGEEWSQAIHKSNDRRKEIFLKNAEVLKGIKFKIKEFVENEANSNIDLYNVLIYFFEERIFKDAINSHKPISVDVVYPFLESLKTNANSTDEMIEIVNLSDCRGYKKFYPLNYYYNDEEEF